jgi:hypothetical protein
MAHDWVPIDPDDLRKAMDKVRDDPDGTRSLFGEMNVLVRERCLPTGAHIELHETMTHGKAAWRVTWAVDSGQFEGWPEEIASQWAFVCVDGGRMCICCWLTFDLCEAEKIFESLVAHA